MYLLRFFNLLHCERYARMIRGLSRQLEAHYEETENEPLSQFSLSPHGIVSLPGDMHLVQASVYDVLRLGIQIQLL